ncbi:hypothetical protein Ae201684P_001399 [Aphanomyces euteiches]|nr:hypothetical protein Ae201684P_001399 [Aphanomyces euteiches]
MEVFTLEEWKDAVAAAEESYDMKAVCILLSMDPAFLVSCFEDVLIHALTVIGPAWITRQQLDFGNGAVLEALDAIFSLSQAKRLAGYHSNPIRTLVVALTRWNTADEIVSRIACRALEAFVQQDGMSALISELLQDEKATETVYELVLTKVCAIPALTHNVFRRDTPPCFTPSTYYSNLSRSFLKHHASRSQRLPVVTRVILLKISRQGHTREYVHEWINLMKTNKTIDLASFVQAIPAVCFDPLFSELFKELDKSDSTALLPLLKWMQVLLHLPTLQHVITSKLLLRPKAPLNSRTLKLLVALIFDPNPSSPFVKIFHQVVQTWAMEFAWQTDTECNESTARFLQLGLERIREDIPEPRAFLDSQGWTIYLCKGVQDHMSHSLLRIRHLGMRVASALSLILSPESPLVFEDLPPDDVQSVESTLTVQLAETSPTQGEVSPHLMLDRDDPDAIVHTDSEDDDNDDDVASQISLEAYDMSDDEETQNENMGKPLVYLFDVREGLMADDNREQVELALASLPGIIARQPHDLADMAIDLAKMLTRLEDAFNTPNFQQLRRESLAGLCTNVPQVVTPVLCEYVYDSEKLFQTKLDILQAVVDASQRLSALGKSPSTFFFPLLNPLESKLIQQSASTWNQEKYLLDDLLTAHVMHTLSVVLESTWKNSPQIPTMGKRFLALIWSQRNHAIPSVRRQVLFGLSRALLVLPTFVWSEEVERLQMRQDLVIYLQQEMQFDPDDGCRQAAKVLLSSVKPMIA